MATGTTPRTGSTPGPGGCSRFELFADGPGTAVPMFFLGGAFQTMASWHGFAAHFAPRTRVLLADLPGMGDAPPLPRRYGIDALAEAAVAVLDATGFDRAFVVAASYATPIAYRLAQRWPGRVDRLVLAGVMPDIPPHLRTRTAHSLGLLASGARDAFATEVVSGLMCGDASADVARRAVVARLLLGQLRRMTPLDEARYVENTARLLEHPPLDLAHPPPVPTLVFTGEHDVYTTPAGCRAVAEALPDAEFTTIARADHLFHLERFDVTAALLDAFYTRGTVAGVADCTPVETFADATAA